MERETRMRNEVVDVSRVEALAAELVQMLGADAVTDEPEALDRASIDGSHLSPVIAEQLPPR